jgi:hypothetical protein
MYATQRYGLGLFLALLVGLAGETAHAQSVTGHVQVAGKDGSPEVVRDAEVLLVCATPEVRAVTDGSIRDIAGIGATSRQHMKGLYETLAGAKQWKNMERLYFAAVYNEVYLPRLPEALYRQLATAAVARGRTSAEGPYEFRDVPSGDYFVVARYTTDTANLLWRIPVRVEDSVQVADLTSTNAIDVAAWLGMSTVVGARRIIDETLLELPRQRPGAIKAASQIRQKTLAEPIPDEFTRPLSCS